MEKITERESVAINCIKTVAIWSVIAAHVVAVSDSSPFVHVVSSLWGMFGRIGVVAFFVIGGFFYSRTKGDGRIFWKKKVSRIIVPWLLCATATFALLCVMHPPFQIGEYLKWIFGSGTWYYYASIYVLFLFLFKWFWEKDSVLFVLIAIQVIAIGLCTVGISTTLPVSFLTDYLNPFHWIGYFSAGILIRRYDLYSAVQKHKAPAWIALPIMIACIGVMYVREIQGYFHVVAMIFTSCAVVLLAKLAYLFAAYPAAVKIGKIGMASYCIYLLHMQIVQFVNGLIPQNGLTILIAPVMGLLVMTIFVIILSVIFKILPFGEKLGMLVGLPGSVWKEEVHTK